MISLLHKGELIALATAGCWTVTALCFEVASRRVGALAVNLFRLILALAFLSLYCRMVQGGWFPTDASPSVWGWLLLSGVIGIFIGDTCLFQAFVLIGARKTMLIMSLAPPLAAIAGWLVMGEVLTPVDWAGMALTVLGVAWVVLEQEPKGPERRPLQVVALGIVLGILSAAAQAIGLVLSKFGMKGYPHPFVATEIRIMAALGMFLVVFSMFKLWPTFKGFLHQKAALGWTAIGAFLGTFLGVSLSLLSVIFIQVGIAVTLMSLVPILIIPPAAFFFKEKITPRAVMGAFIAVAGVAILFI